MSSVASSAPFRLPSAPVRTDLVAKYFRGLGDPSRLRILELLRSEGELSVGELVERLRLPQPKVSNHLACLRWCGFIEARREGRIVYNRIADPRIAAMLDLAESLLADNAEHVAVCCRGAGTMSRPRVEILYFDGCPNHQQARALVERIAAELAVEPEIEIVHVPGADAATQLRFLGSPTVRVNGVDVEPGAERRSDFVFSCRVYRAEHGFSGQPDEEWIRDALAEATA